MQIRANGIAIEVADQGAPGAEPLLLVMGLGMQLVAWPDELVRLLLARGFRVLRIDNRDAGLSQQFDHLGVPNLALAAMRYLLRLPVRAPYALADMAADATGVLDALGIGAAHVCGASMGGMVAQHIAARQPRRVKSLTLMMTTSGARRLPQPRWELQRALMARPAGSDTAAVVDHLVRLMRLIGSPAYRQDEAELRRRLRAGVLRAWRPAGTARQMLAIAADGDRSALLRAIEAPVQLIHGEADPLVPVAAAHDLARKIAAAALEVVPGMGHDLPQALLARFADAIAGNAARATGTAFGRGASAWPAARRV